MEAEFEITDIIPFYDYKNVSGGYFKIFYNYDGAETFNLSFVPFLDSRVRQSTELFEYLKKTTKDLTVSHAIYDLYDLGFPVDDWVREYIEGAKESISGNIFNELVKFYNFIKDFNNPSGSL
jgi:hypothetical protein